MSTNAEFYEKDFYAWTQETAALIAAGKWHEIDQALLADEVAGLGRDDQREIARRVQRLLKELLLWWALPGERKGNWAAAIIEERARLEDIVEDSPSLKAQLGEVVAKEYPWATGQSAGPDHGVRLPRAMSVHRGAGPGPRLLSGRRDPGDHHAVRARDRRALASHLENLLVHLLKWRYQPAGRQTGHSWADSIRAARTQLAAGLSDAYADSPQFHDSAGAALPRCPP